MVQPPRNREARIDLPAVAALCLWGAIGLLTLGALARRGAAAGTASEFVVVLAVFVSLTACLAAWSLFHWSGERGDTARRMLDGLLSLVPAAVLGIALAVDSSAFALCLISLFLGIGGVFLMLSEVVRLGLLDQIPVDETSGAAPGGKIYAKEARANGRPPSDDAVPAMQPTAGSGVDMPPADPILADAPSQALWPAGLTQRVIRCQPEGGGEEIEAVLIARFSAGERETTLHLPLHPPLTGVPTVETEPLDDEEIEIHVSNARPYGVRLEVRRMGDLSEPAAAAVGLRLTTITAAASAA